MGKSSNANANNHSNQMNPNNPAYWSSRGLPPTPSAETPSAPTTLPPASPSTPIGAGTGTSTTDAGKGK